MRAEESAKDKSYLKGLKKIPVLAEKLLKQYHSKRNVLAREAEEFHKYYLARNNKGCFLYLARNMWTVLVVRLERGYKSEMEKMV